MGFDYYHHKVLRDGLDQELRERHLHARLLSERPRRPARVPRWRRATAAILAPITQRPHRRDSGPAAPAAIPATIAAVVAAPMVGVDASAIVVDQAAATGLAVTQVRTAQFARELTAAVCRLPSGSLGRIAIERLGGDDWIAVCVEAPTEDTMVASVSTRVAPSLEEDR